MCVCEKLGELFFAINIERCKEPKGTIAHGAINQDWSDLITETNKRLIESIVYNYTWLNINQCELM